MIDDGKVTTMNETTTTIMTRRKRKRTWTEILKESKTGRGLQGLVFVVDVLRLLTITIKTIRAKCE
jgi:hypothetical protein